FSTDFRRRCMDKLNELGDEAMDSAAHRDAAAYYSSALTLDPLSTDVLDRRSRAHAAMGDWEAALEDANAAIALDPSHPSGYERKHAALHGCGRYDEAIETLNEMLLKFEQSPDRHTRGKCLPYPVEHLVTKFCLAELYNHYVNPSQTIAAIHSFAKHTQREFPLVLIDTKNGHLCDEQERIRMFEVDPKFKQLVSSMVSQIDNTGIDQIVREYFRYATFSHTWEGDEPLYHDILHESVHNLAGSPQVMKLLMFCKIVWEAGFRWAWSDTCCINKTDGAALQESLTSMFQWYHESSLTIIHLKGVLSDSELGALVESLWNTRAWTLQEFFASKVIRFYTEDWKPYLLMRIFSITRNPLSSCKRWHSRLGLRQRNFSLCVQDQRTFDRSSALLQLALLQSKKISLTRCSGYLMSLYRSRMVKGNGVRSVVFYKRSSRVRGCHNPGLDWEGIGL
ncbi:hypothetical protein J3R83DRAFT_13461, partial [Lanmaoa asiatica]